MSAAPRVSVVVPTHDRAEMVARAVASVLAQTFEDLEVVVVDDGSRDGTKAKIEAMKDARVRVVRRETASGRPAVARNLGIEAARGEFVAFLDDDDRWYEAKLAKQMEALAARPDLAIVAARVQCTGADASTWPSSPLLPCTYATLTETNLIACSTALVRRDVLDEERGFDTSPALAAAEDWDLWLRIARARPFVVLEDVLAEYTVHAGGISKNRLRELSAAATCLARLADRDPTVAKRVRRRVGDYRRELAQELWKRRRFVDAARVALGSTRVSS